MLRGASYFSVVDKGYVESTKKLGKVHMYNKSDRRINTFDLYKMRLVNTS